MLTTTVQPTSVHIDVHNRVLHHALLHVVEAAGWRSTQHRHDGVRVVSDRVTAERGADVLMVEPTPISCRSGIDAVFAGQARSLVCADDPETLTDALAGLDDDWCLIPVRVVALSAAVPPLSDRQQQIVRAIAAGQPNRMIARGLRVSEATVKREVASLLRTFDATDRLGLISHLGPLGLLPQRLHG